MGVQMNFRNFLRWVGAFVFTMGIVILMVYAAERWTEYYSMVR